MQRINTVIFDIGGVLIDASPKHLYRKLFQGDEEKLDWFLNQICTTDWNLEQDAGKNVHIATQELIQKYPEYDILIKAYYERWEEMVAGTIEESIKLLECLRQKNNYKLFALTNWSAETFPRALEVFDFLMHFDGIVVSGYENIRKPYSKIYQIILDRYKIIPEKSVFIDDRIENITAAKTMGIHGIHFRNPAQLKNDLLKLGVIF